MSLDNDDDLDDELALFEKQIEQVAAFPPPPPKTQLPSHPSATATATATATTTAIVAVAPTASLAAPTHSAASHPSSSALSVSPKPSTRIAPPSKHHPSPSNARPSLSTGRANQRAQGASHRWFWNGQAWLWVPRDAVTSRKPAASSTPFARSNPSASTAALQFSHPVPTTASAAVAEDDTVEADAAVNTASNTDNETFLASSESSQLSRAPSGGNTVTKRTAAGQVWHDATMSYWPDNDHRLFVGDLAPDATDDELVVAFSKYASFNMARVVKDKRSNACRGYGFVSFASAQDMLNAFKQMNGKYVGSRPIKLRRSNWQKRTLHKDKWKQVRALRTISKH